MSYIIKAILSIIFKGTIDPASDKKVPLFFRILTGILFLTAYLGFVGYLIYYGINEHDHIIIIIAVAILALIAWITARKYTELKN